MPMPTEERLSQLTAGLVERRGFDLEGVEISTTGKHSEAVQGQERSLRSDQSLRVKVTVDSDGPSDLDTIAKLSTELSELLDEAGDFGETPYLLEVTTPGVDRPLTADRHWRRARGRKVRVHLRAGAPVPDSGGSAKFEARVGELSGDTVALVLGGKHKPHRVRVPLADIAEAVVQVEFAKPGARELELAGGVVPGRPVPGQEDDVPAVDAADVRGTTPLLPESVTASDSPTEGTVE
ncbi:ribosome maturation factor RimP [Nocardia iowensis]|uniref:Ribosome maturation factor RimP n=1 Tax=Nocardia iowensis TaxID=204891 RepID=A0ABX8RIZ6_NOCIO|nr:ribosome maturation factor RimP [Nocardia iowensis]QXN89602.1 ribosome maturation factor RimP [Nocardia iowensis]